METKTQQHVCVYSWVGKCVSVQVKRNSSHQNGPEESQPPPQKGLLGKCIECYRKQNRTTSVFALMSRQLCLSSYWRPDAGKGKAPKMVLIQWIWNSNTRSRRWSPNLSKKIKTEAWTAGKVKYFFCLVKLGGFCLYLEKDQDLIM